MEIRPENEYDKLLSLSNEYYQETNECRPCGGYSLHYECACDFHEIPMHKAVQIVSDEEKNSRMLCFFCFRLLIQYLLIEYHENLPFENLNLLLKKNGYRLSVLYVIMNGFER